MNGDGVPRDFARGLALFQQAADQGDTKAKYYLPELLSRADAMTEKLNRQEEASSSSNKRNEKNDSNKKSSNQVASPMVQQPVHNDPACCAPTHIAIYCRLR